MLSNSNNLSATTGIPSRSPGANEVLRSKNKKRDEQIRKKVELELKNRTTRRKPSNSTPRRNSRGTVSSLKPNPAITILETAKIIQACQLMAAKRTDAVLVVSDQGDLIGILTDKDITFRVVAEGLSVRSTKVAEVMTKDPIAVDETGNRNEALNIMVSRRFRHLPVISDPADDEYEQQLPIGLLDITKCVFERLDDLERKVNEDQSIINAMEVLERRGTMNADRIDSMRNEHECPDIASVLTKGGKPFGDFASISVKSSVRDAAIVMKAAHGTAVLVTGTPDGEDKIGGIFTTKDVVLRVIAANLEPATTSVIRVMTPHPEFVQSSASILDALKKLHIGHFLHLPVIDDGTPVGLVDVMTLTISMLQYLVTMYLTKMTKSGVVGDIGEEGPMWNNFWNSTFSHPQELDQMSHNSEPKPSPSTYLSYKRSIPERERFVSPEPSIARESIVSRHPSQSIRPALPELFSFKLKDLFNSNKFYRFSSGSESLFALYENVCLKTGYTHSLTPDLNSDSNLDIIRKQGESVRLCYVDEDGDVLFLESDKDLTEAVQMAVSGNSLRLVLYLGDPSSELSEIKAEAKQHSRHSTVSIERELISKAQKTEKSVFDSLKEAPLSVNIALSAGIFVVAYYIIRKIG